METNSDAIFNKVLQQNLRTDWGRKEEGGEEDGSKDKEQPQTDR